jgi:hypothetical protein
MALRPFGEQELERERQFPAAAGVVQVPRGLSKPRLEVREVEIALEAPEDLLSDLVFHRQGFPHLRPVQRITSAELRRIFNDSQLWERAQTGEFEERVLWLSHPAPRRSGEPFCTESQMVGYFETSGNRRRIALVHQYLRPDGSVGASGRPDPKAILDRGTLLIPSRRTGPE